MKKHGVRIGLLSVMLVMIAALLCGCASQKASASGKQDDRLVGMADLRLAVNEKILLYYGQIGYSIRPGERGKGYGNRQLKLVLEAARARGMDRVLLTWTSGNRASARLIQKNGGALENTVKDPETGDVMERYWIAL